MKKIIIMLILLSLPTVFADTLGVNDQTTNPNVQMAVNVVEIGNENGKEYVDLEIYYSDRESYDTDIHGGNNGFFPNPANYPDLYTSNLLQYATVVYRTHYNCDGTIENIWSSGKERINLSDGYKNVLCRSRKQEQCYLDGSFDTYYDERCDFGVVRFHENEIESASNFNVEVGNIDVESRKADVKITEKTLVNIKQDNPMYTEQPTNVEQSNDEKGKITEQDRKEFTDAVKTILRIFFKMN